MLKCDGTLLCRDRSAAAWHCACFSFLLDMSFIIYFLCKMQVWKYTNFTKIALQCKYMGLPIYFLLTTRFNVLPFLYKWSIDMRCCRLGDIIIIYHYCWYTGCFFIPWSPHFYTNKDIGMIIRSIVIEIPSFMSRSKVTNMQLFCDFRPF